MDVEASDQPAAKLPEREAIVLIDEPHVEEVQVPIKDSLPLQQSPSVEAINPPSSAKHHRLTRRGRRVIEVSHLFIHKLVISCAKSYISYFLFSHRRLHPDDDMGATDDVVDNLSGGNSPLP